MMGTMVVIVLMVLVGANGCGNGSDGVVKAVVTAVVFPWRWWW